MKLFFTLLLISVTVSLLAQPAQFFFGGDSTDQIQQILPAPNGNYFLVGSKGDTSGSKVWLQEMTPAGNIVSEHTYSFNWPSYGHGMKILPDGNLLIFGQMLTSNYASGLRAIAIKTDPSGNVIWQKSNYTVNTFSDALPVGDHYILVGGSHISKLDQEGELLWQEEFSFSGQRYIKKIFPTADGNFLLTGRSNNIGAGYQGIFIRKITPDGGLIWANTFDTGYREENFNAQEVVNKPLGALFMPDESIWVVNPQDIADITMLHISSEGDLLEQINYGDSGIHEYPYSLSLLPDGGWLIAGSARKNGSPLDYCGFAMRLDSQGYEIWRKYYGSQQPVDRLINAIQTPDGQFLMAGMSNAPINGAGKFDGWLLRAEPNGNVLPWKVQGKIVFDINENCTADANEPPASGWFVKIQNDSLNQTLVTDLNGSFCYNTDNASNVFTVNASQPDLWTFCNNSIAIFSNSTNPLDTVIFLVKPVDGSCSHVQVSITQPDLVRCKTSRFFVTLTNNGTMASETLLLQVEVDPELTVLTASEPFVQNGSIIEFMLPPLTGLSTRTLEIKAVLSCDVQLGSTHAVVARIGPLACTPEWEGAVFTVKGHCNGDQVQFDLQNIGGGGPNTSTHYRVIADYLIAFDWEDIILSGGGAAQTLSFPADGRTWRVEVMQKPAYPYEKMASASVEACGVEPRTNLPEIGYRNAFSTYDGRPDVSAALSPNTTGVPNKIAEALNGSGYYNIINQKGALEFTARVRNPISEIVDEVIFQFKLSPTLVMTSFRPLASNTPVEIFFTGENELNVRMLNVQLDTGATPDADAFLRFRIETLSDLPPDNGEASFILLEGKAFFNGKGPKDILPGFSNYSALLPAENDTYNDYPAEITLFGGNTFTFSNSATLSSDGSVFLTGESLTYSDRTDFDGLVIKTDSTGKALWLNAIDLGEQTRNDFKDAVPLPDGGCIAAGSSLEVGGNYLYTSSYYASICRLDSMGNLLWHKKFRPGGQIYGAAVRGVIRASDGYPVVFGVATNAQGSDHFYAKFDPDGHVEWINYDLLNNSSFKPDAAITLPDGSMIFSGENNDSELDFELYLQKINPEGEVVWSTGYNSVDGFNFKDLAPTSDNGVLVTGYSQWSPAPGEYVQTPVFMKFSNTGDFEWEKNILIGPYKIARAYCIVPVTAEGTFLVGGMVVVDSIFPLFDMMLLKIDENADTLWYKTYGAKNGETTTDIVITGENRVLIWGYNQPLSPAFELQALLVHTDLEGNLITETSAPHIPVQGTVTLFPNPAHTIVHVIVSPEPVHAVPWQLYDFSGRQLAKGIAESSFFSIDTEAFPSGMYFLAFPEGGYSTQRLAIVR